MSVSSGALVAGGGGTSDALIQRRFILDEQGKKDKDGNPLMSLRAIGLDGHFVRFHRFENGEPLFCEVDAVKVFTGFNQTHAGKTTTIR